MKRVFNSEQNKKDLSPVKRNLGRKRVKMYKFFFTFVTTFVLNQIHFSFVVIGYYHHYYSHHHHHHTNSENRSTGRVKQSKREEKSLLYCFLVVYGGCRRGWLLEGVISGRYYYYSRIKWVTGSNGI